MKTVWGLGVRCLPVCSVLACGGGEAEPFHETDDAGDFGASCKDEPMALAGVDEVSPLGFAAAEVLAMAEGEHTTPMVWAEAYDDGPWLVEFGPESGESELTATITYDGGEIRHVVSTPEEGDGFGDGWEEPCSDRMEIDVRLEVRSEGGAFDEDVDAVLVATAPIYATIGKELALDEIQGSFEITRKSPDHLEVLPITLNLGLSKFGMTGSADGGLQIEEGGDGGEGWVGFGWISYAAWPGGERQCDLGEVAAPLDGAFQEFSGQDVLDLIGAATDLSITWQGGDPSPLTVTASDAGKAICFSAVGGYEGEGLGSLRMDATLDVAAEDESIAGTFDVVLTGRPAADGTLEEAHLSIYAPYANQLSPAEFEDTYGITGVDFTGYERAGLTFSGSYFPDGGAVGALTVLGIIPADCDDVPVGEGCEGDTIDEIAMASWGNR